MLQRALIQRQRGLDRIDHLGAAGMTDELVDVADIQLHAAENLRQRRLEFGRDEIGDGAAKDQAEAERIDVPSHDVERIRDQIFAASLDSSYGAGAATQPPPRRAV